MSERRRLSTRNRGEPPLKKRALSSPTPAAPLPPPPQPQLAEPIEEGLPTRLKEGQRLPTLSEPQDGKLSHKTYQSIAESGVLSTAIERSRQKWITEGVFDRYWAKPTKKKAIGETPNPAKESMSRLGVCSLIIEPHVFDVTLYTVKDLPMSFNASNGQPLPPQQRPFQYSTTYPPSNYPTPAVPYPANGGQQPIKPFQPSLPPFQEGFAKFSAQAAPPIYHPAGPGPAIASDPASLSRSNSNGHDGFSTRDDDPKADPVIQMLASRAASDPTLKALMKVVASGQASPEQLRNFQGQIDELNKILKSQHNIDTPFRTESQPKPDTEGGQEHVSHPHISASATANSRPPTHPTVSVVVPAPSQTMAPIKTEPFSQYYSTDSQPVKPKQTGSYRPDIHSIVFDFGGTGDRFLFPRFSILEYLPGGTQVMVSFLVIRRGNTASGKYKETKSYYQPITIRLSTSSPRIFEPLARTVPPADEVRRYMDSVFDKMSPAESVFLAIRLPRSKDEEDSEKHEIHVAADLIKPVYSPPNFLMPLAA